MLKAEEVIDFILLLNWSMTMIGAGRAICQCGFGKHNRLVLP